MDEITGAAAHGACSARRRADATIRSSGLDGCSSGRLGAFDGNVFLPSTTGVLSQGPSTCGETPTEYAQVGALVTAKLIPEVGKNVRVSADCGPKELGCVSAAACTTAPACQKAIFGVDATLADLEKGLLAPLLTAPCAAIRRSPLLEDVPLDGYGVARTAPVSAGAIERDQCL